MANNTLLLAMYLKHLSIANFKNIVSAELNFSPNINCILGNNGEGKTNLLDAVYYLSMTKSYFGGSDALNILHGESYFTIQGNYLREETEEIAFCGVQRGEGKVFKRNGKLYERLLEHIGILPLVMISPTDSELINEAGEERRKYMNYLLSQISRDYLNASVRYNHILLQRNKLLKTPYSSASEEVLQTLDAQLAQQAVIIYESRKNLIAELEPTVTQLYHRLSGGRENAGLSYRSDLADGTMTELLTKSRERDRVMQHTTKGIHRDDIIMQLDGYSLRRIGSQGQQKTFLLALKLAQYELLKQHSGFFPILLLDDIFDKLDENRMQQLIAITAQESFGQIFLTDSNKVRLNAMVKVFTQDYVIFTTAKGAFYATT